jgi:hypothetical protein
MVIFDVADTCADQPADHFIGRVGGQHRLEITRGRRLLAKPQRPHRGLEHEGHAVVPRSRRPRRPLRRDVQPPTMRAINNTRKVSHLIVNELIFCETASSLGDAIKMNYLIDEAGLHR